MNKGKTLKNKKHVALETISFLLLFYNIRTQFSILTPQINWKKKTYMYVMQWLH